LQVLDVKLPFDEMSLLRENTTYLLRSLGLAALDVRSAVDLPSSGLPAGHEQALPGQPVAIFDTQPVASS